MKTAAQMFKALGFKPLAKNELKYFIDTNAVLGYKNDSGLELVFDKKGKCTVKQMYGFDITNKLMTAMHKQMNELEMAK